MNDELCDWNALYHELLTEGLDTAEIERRKARLLAEVRAYKLVEMRTRRGLTRHDIAEIMGVPDSVVSRIESGELASVHELSPYAAALGGRLRIFVDFGDDMVSIGD